MANNKAGVAKRAVKKVAVKVPAVRAARAGRVAADDPLSAQRVAYLTDVF
jgi:hypothetical protein